jgi:hypothetical protein
MNLDGKPPLLSTLPAALAGLDGNVPVLLIREEDVRMAHILSI